MSKRKQVLSDIEDIIENGIKWIRTLELNKGRMSIEEYQQWNMEELKSIQLWRDLREKIINNEYKFFMDYKPIEGAEEIAFSHNWNNKLDSDFFTTLRLANANKYTVGKKFNIVFKKDFKKPCELISVREISIGQLNEFICGLDTGYNVQETQDILRKMYSKVNWETQKLNLCLLKTIKPKKQEDETKQ